MLPRRCLGVSVALRFFVVVRWIPSAGEFDFFVALRLCLANPNPGLDKEVAGYSSCGCDIGSFVCGVISFRELIGIVEIRSLNICYHEIVELFRCRFIRALCLSHLVYWYLKPILQVHFELFCDWIVIILDASVSFLVQQCNAMFSRSSVRGNFIFVMRVCLIEFFRVQYRVSELQSCDVSVAFRLSSSLFFAYISWGRAGRKMLRSF